MSEDYKVTVLHPRSSRPYGFSFDKKGNKTKIADGVTKAIREEDGDIVYDSRHDLMLYQKEESERIGIGIVDFWYADEMKTEQNFRLDW